MKFAENCIAADWIEVLLGVPSMNGMNAAAEEYPPVLIAGDNPETVVPDQLV